MKADNINNNPQEKWIEQIKNKINDIQPEIPAGGFDAVMKDLNSASIGNISNKNRRTFLYILPYAAAILLLIVLPATIYILKQQGSNENQFHAETLAENKSIKENSKTDNNKDFSKTSNNKQSSETNTETYKLVSDTKLLANAEPYKHEKKQQYKNIEKPTHSSIIESNNPASQNTLANKSNANEAENKTTETENKNIAEDSNISSTQNEYKDYQKNTEIVLTDNYNWDENDKKNIYRETNTTSIGINIGNTSAGNSSIINKEHSSIPDNTLNYASITTFSSSVQVKDNFINGDYSHKLPITIGLTVAKRFNKRWTVETGISYAYMESTVNDDSKKYTQKLHYIGLPINANWHFVNSRTIDAYIGGGTSFYKCISGSFENDKLSIKKLEMFANVHAGIMFNINNNWGLYLQPGVQLRLNNKDLGQYRGLNIENYFSKKDISITANAGFKFSF